MPPKMTDRMEALETQLGTVTATLQELALQMQQQSLVLTELSKQVGSKGVVPEGETSTGDSNMGESRLAGKKVKLPVFEGEDPVAWITRAEIYFDVQNTPDELRVKLSRLSMEGSTIHWFNLLMETEDELSWEKLKRALIARYGGRRLENPFEELSTLRQRGSVEEFVEAFELLSSQVGRLPEDQYLGYFMSGLKPLIRRRVRTLNPTTRMEMMRIAKDIEDELKEEDDEEGKRVIRKPGYERAGQGDWAGSSAARSGPYVTARSGPYATKDPNQFSKSSGSIPTRSLSLTGTNSTTSSMGSTARNTGGDYRPGSSERWKGVRRFPVDEIAERRAKGLCFKCGGKYHPTLHKCPERSLRVLILGEGETIDDEGEIVMLEGDQPEDEEEEEPAALKLMGVLGCMAETQTMKLSGQVGHVELLVLIDSGASHNFISPTITSALGLTITTTHPRSIKLGDGHKVVTKGICKGIKAKLGSIEITIDALVLELGELDLVMGVSWLRTLGKVLMDWKMMTMQFIHGGQVVKLQGLGNKDSQQSNLHSFLNDTQGREKMEWWWPQLNLTEVTRAVEESPHQLQALLKEFQAVFTTKIQLPPERSKVHQINLFPDQGPINVRPYRYPHHQKEEIEKQVSELMEAGIIRPSMSSYSSPVILVKKKDKSWRMCVDYRALNKATIPDKYPIPIVDELLDELNGATMFSKIDLKSGYHQIRVHENDVPKTTFRTHNGHYEYLVMPFGLMNAPATFQAIMNDIFRPYLRKFVLVFFDDILIYSKDLNEHIGHLELVLSVLLSNCFVANQSKCRFGCRQVDYLGHLISGDGVAVDPDKVQCIEAWPEPKNVKGVRGFLGLTGYYREFIKDYGKVAKPLTELTKKDNFWWGPEAQQAFTLLKSVMTTSPVLALPDFNLPFEVECDAAGRGIGAVLMQQRRPIAYFSKALSAGNLAKSVYEKELMALVLCIQHWRHYLLGRVFIVYTDHKSLKHFLQQRVSSPDQQCWLAKLLGYQFEVKYKSGLENKAADALSRCFDDVELHSLISFPLWQDRKKLLDELAHDSYIQNLTVEVQKDPHSKPGFVLQQGVLLYQGRLVLSPQSPSIPWLLAEFHGSPTGGHSGFYRTYRRLAESLYWVGMQKRVRDFVRECDVCQRQKYSATTPGGLLRPLPIPNAVWEDISLDFITGLPKSKGYEAILVVVDRLSKYSHFILLKHPYTAKSIAEIFAKEIVRLHGIPSSVVSDRDPIFVSHFWSELFKLQGTTLKMSSAYHPETDGQTEVTNRCLESYLRCFASDHPKTWSYWVPWAEFWYNSTFHTSIGQTPFEVVYGRKAPPLVRFLSNETKVAAVALDLSERDEAIKQLREHLKKAQEQMASYANKKRRDLNFEVGEWVFLKLRPHRQHSVVKRINQKLAARFYGPFQIETKIGAVAYKLKLPDDSKIHPVFHVSLLKKAIGSSQVQGQLPRDLEIEEMTDIYPESIIGTRTIRQGDGEVHQSLIKWNHKSLDDVTWEDNAVLAGQFPDFCLEDKAVSEGEGIDRDLNANLGLGKPKVWKVYVRKKGRKE
ncbi:transposon Tf2-1 polyprotein isoform X1 [Lotus japonicus]|uniref:transposon Tf2-1 polyprotein isoform X1 n=1 Tax=Lotus japonicus TaxID=34305 RepID=UPI0025859E9D|nr:transposon Tf2-1 polyprotein isoform X1 [Lotus japonicus]XP_057438198.1 transposon Tf2-1 polyprotein isoform X1 [Lotus japonicus]XP_057438199.1 transposon Tf2-1 polyprotein isoform X1 [Lotus japonicus]